MDKPRILVIDDEPDVGRLLKLMLDEQYEVNTTTNVDTFLGALRENQADCVISDVRMPGMTGFELFEKVREINKEIPVIFITGFIDHRTDQELKDRSIPFVCKPFSENDLFKALSSVNLTPKAS